MSNATDDDLDFDLGDEAGTDVAALRKKFEKQLREKAAALKDATERLAQIEKETRTNSLKEMFGRLVGADKAGLAKYYAGEPTEDAVKAWIAEDGGLFGVSLDQEPPKADVSDPNVKAMQRVAAASAGANNPGTGVEETLAAMQAVTGNPYAALNQALSSAIS
jgi:hypothetical protein